MPSNSNRKRLATAYARAADLPYQSALARVVELQALGIELSCRDAAALQQSVLLLQGLPQKIGGIESPTLPSSVDQVRELVSTALPTPYSATEQPVLLGYAEDLSEVRLGSRDAMRWNAHPAILLAGRPGTGKTWLMLQIAHQQIQLNERIWYLNFKVDAPLSPVFEHFGMKQVRMSPEVLRQNPGALDPMLTGDRRLAAKVLVSFVKRMLRWPSHPKPAQSLNEAQLITRIAASADDARNLTSRDVLWGNDAQQEHLRTRGVPEATALRWHLGSPFVSAVLGVNASGTDLITDIREGNVLVQWSEDWATPSSDKASAHLTDGEVAATAWGLYVFMLALDSADRQDSTFIVDDSDWLLSHCPEAGDLLLRAGRERRAPKTMPIVGAQSLALLSAKAPTLLDSFGRMVLLGLYENFDDEIEIFSRLTGLPASEYHRWARLGPGLGRYVDRINNWQGLVAIKPPQT